MMKIVRVAFGLSFVLALSPGPSDMAATAAAPAYDAETIVSCRGDGEGDVECRVIEVRCYPICRSGFCCWVS